MRLKRLELFGFKSFADRTVLEFGANTLTGVVGPNGCGKSNVVDSVRWVLGEQRPTSMRGSEMTDVIFKGSQSRPALSVAEVTLILDNASSVLAGRGSEVSITRRVFKSGEGEYLLDGEKVRLKDIREMLFDTGLGSRGYAVLEQGKIDAVLSANPLERRRIFEEAAGVSRYRQRKLETELRLKRVAEDMNRLDDVIGELATRVRSLKIQAGKAQRFVEARELWARERTRAIRHRLWVLEREIDEVGGASRALDERAANLRSLRAGAEQDAQSRDRERGALAAEIERLASDSARLAGDGRALDERRAQLSGRIASWKAQAKEEGERARAQEAALAERQAELAALAVELARLEAENARSHAAAAEHAAALRELERRTRELRGRSQQQNDAVLALLHQKSQAENSVRHLGAARAPAAEREARLRERLDAAAAAVAAMRGDEQRAESELARAQAALARHEELRRGIQSELETLAQRSAAAEQEKNALELERARVTSRIEALLDRERDLEELSSGARRLLEGVAASGTPCASDALSGLVADHLRTDTRHARALDAVLGARANALVARDEATARAIAAWLASGGGGQVGVVLPGGFAPAAAPASAGASTGSAPGSSVSSPGSPLADVLAPALDDPRVRGRLREQVRCARGCERLADLLCGDVLIADDVASALALVQAHPRLRCVTLDGELVDAAQLLGGHRTLTQGAVGRRASADELQAEVLELGRSLAALETRRSELAAEQAGLAQRGAQASIELDQLRQAQARCESALSTARARVRDLAAAHALLEQEATAAHADQSRIEGELAASMERERSVRAEFEREQGALEELERVRRGLEQEREDGARQENQAQLSAARAKAELEGLTRRQGDLRRMCAETSSEHERAARLARESEEHARAAAADVERLAQQSAELLTARGELDRRLGELRALAEEGRTSAEVLRKRAEAVTRELEETSSTLAERRLLDQRLQLARAELVRRAEEELQLAEHALGAGFEPEQELREPERLAALESEVRELREKLDKLGPVNMEALGELDETSTRLDFLTRQHADLAQSRTALSEASAAIDSESKRLFLETFETVRANFQRVFRQLFGGGRADVELEEGVDVLEAGVEIVARPPGRELLSIGLLSGGQRTLTALALLFAVFEARPSPFCILDEVDAALDDANIDRFLGLLEGFRKHTQFVIVTHNKGTMAACESLYGVTMETKGVSRPVSVELADAEHWIERPGDGAARGVASNAGAHGGGGNGRGSSTAHPVLDGESGEPAFELVPARPGKIGEIGESHAAEAEPALALEPGAGSERAG